MTARALAARWRKLVAQRFEPPVPAHLRSRFTTGEPRALAAFASALREHLEAGQPAAYLETARGGKDLDEHLRGRLDTFRRGVIPWLDDARPLASSRVLEIGCGTGASTVALAEQGAAVSAVDADARSLELAGRRCRAHGVAADLHEANATAIGELFEAGAFDLVIFFASLEHMTHGERLESMRRAWELLEPGGLWCVAQTPNRLWHTDDHTSRLPFFMWLPDDLAFDYSRLSPREGFREIYRRRDAESLLHFLRRGRGVSFHEFDLALGPAENLRVISSLARFKNRNPLRRALIRLGRAHRYQTFLTRTAGRPIDPSFFQPYLYLILEKG